MLFPKKICLFIETQRIFCSNVTDEIILPGSPSKRLFCYHNKNICNSILNSKQRLKVLWTKRKYLYVSTLNRLLEKRTGTIYVVLPPSASYRTLIQSCLHRKYSINNYDNLHCLHNRRKELKKWLTCQDTRPSSVNS